MINIIENVVTQDLCVGCGACAYQNRSKDLRMDWNKEGFLIPTIKDNAVSLSASSIQVCPFNPFPENKVRSEDELSDIFLKETPNFHPQAGKYFNTYAGYAEKFRLTSSSGGLATYLLSELFEQKLIDAAIAVGEGKNNHYEYKLVKKKEDLLTTSKTKYYPVSMADALNELKSFDGKAAVVGIGCFIKSVRLLQHYNPELREKIVFTIGIICGGLKSRFFTEYLAQKAGVKGNYTKQEYRIKDIKSTASDYSFGAYDDRKEFRQIKMRTVGDMWGSGLFKANACDFCDDVTSELADVSLGDAWLKPYNEDGRGTNVLITRTKLAEHLIEYGKNNKELNLDNINIEAFLKSQQSSFYHRQKALRFRVKKLQKEEKLLLPKRQIKEKISLDFKWVQLQRMKVRKVSLVYWSQLSEVVKFEISINKDLSILNNLTYFYHACRAFRKRILKKRQ